jgi:hypothetical protein
MIGVKNMKISEIIKSTPELIKARIGIGPYLYYSSDNQTINIDCSLGRIISMHMKDNEILNDIEIYAYGFKKNESDEHQYINEDDLKKRFEQMNNNGTYEYISAEENNGIVYQVPSYCGFDELLYFDKNNENLIVNCEPIKVVIQEEIQKRIEKSNMIRR